MIRNTFWSSISHIRIALKKDPQTRSLKKFPHVCFRNKPLKFIEHENNFWKQNLIWLIWRCKKVKKAAETDVTDPRFSFARTGKFSSTVLYPNRWSLESWNMHVCIALFVVYPQRCDTSFNLSYLQQKLNEWTLFFLLQKSSIFVFDTAIFLCSSCELGKDNNWKRTMGYKDMQTLWERK